MTFFKTAPILFKERVLVRPDGVTVHFDVGNNCQSPEEITHVLTLISGYSRSRKDFSTFRRKLHAKQPGLVTVSLDLRGSGDTEIFDPALVNLENMASDVSSVLKTVLSELQKDSYALLGISMGGMVSQIASKMDSSLKKLILVSTTAGGKTRVLSSSMPPAESYVAPLYVEKNPLFFQQLKASLEAGRRENPFLKGQAQSVGSFDIDNYPGQILAEALIISGDSDSIIPLINSHEIKKRIENSRICVYEGVGHIILVEAPERLEKDVLEFLS